MSNHSLCPHCRGIITAPRRTTLEAAQAVHAQTCPALRRVTS